MGKIYVIESGSDSCGKETQTNLLYNYFKNKNCKVKKFTFPNYKSESSTFVKMYLNGDFGKNPNSVDPYITSTFYAIDRYVTFKKEIESYYNNDYIILFDRYVTSNMIYQSSKINNIEEKNKFLNWLYEFEYEIYKLPKPDKVFFLDLPFKISYNLLCERKKKNLEKNNFQDIHESNIKYLENVYNNSKYIANKYGFINIDCSLKNSIKTVDEIHELILKKL